MLEPIIVLFTNVLLYLYGVLDNSMVLALVLLTVGVRAILIPLSVYQQKSQAKMQELQPQIKVIQEQHKDDPQRMQAELLAIGYNPASMLTGCLPLIIQFPILISMYRCIERAIPDTPLRMVNLYNTVYPSLFDNFAGLVPVERQFLWMDLAQRERLFVDFLPWGIPVLAILVVITTVLQQKMMMPNNTDPNDQTAQMQRSMMTTMPIMFGFISLQFAAGLSIYFVVANLVTMLQTAVVNRERFHWIEWSLPGGIASIPFPSFAAEPKAIPKPTKATIKAKSSSVSKAASDEKTAAAAPKKKKKKKKKK